MKIFLTAASSFFLGVSLCLFLFPVYKYVQVEFKGVHLNPNPGSENQPIYEGLFCTMEYFHGARIAIWDFKGFLGAYDQDQNYKHCNELGVY